MDEVKRKELLAEGGHLCTRLGRDVGEWVMVVGRSEGGGDWGEGEDESDGSSRESSHFAGFFCASDRKR